MASQGELEQLRTALQKANRVQSELDRRMYYLRTLYDVSKDLFASVDFHAILKNFLLMTMGNFGVGEGVILTWDCTQKQINGFLSMGVSLEDQHQLRKNSEAVLNLLTTDKKDKPLSELKTAGLIPYCLAVLVSFQLNSRITGMLGLGNKLIDEPYNKDDRELLNTLANNLVVALKNARSFQKIQGLNHDLKEKNTQLEHTLSKLKASMRKVEILESIKENLNKFVPVTVSRMIEKSPGNNICESKRQDLSVLFVDIEGYTRLCEKFAGDEINTMIEKHFSAFMEAIYTHNGDVAETAGDGLMVLFLNENQEKNALDAVRAALAIKEQTALIFKECSALYRPLDINMGINSGKALVGAARFETYSGSRWTFTARGNLTNLAARIGALATGGTILLSKTTAMRVKKHFSVAYNGKFSLKNVSEKIDIFRI